MKIKANSLNSKMAMETIKDTIELNHTLKRLCQNRMSAEEMVGLLQKYRLMSQLQREIVIDAAIESIELTDEEVFSGYKAFYQQYQINSDEDRANWLKSNHLNLAQFEHFILRALKLDRFKQQTFASKVDSYFLQRKSQLDRASYSVLGVKSFHLAQELFLQVQDGEASFSELIAQYSEGADENNGLRGPHELSIPHPILADRLRSLKPGQLAPPFQLGNWFILVRLEKYFSAQLDDKMRARSIDELYDSWLQSQFDRSICGLESEKLI